MEVLRIPDHPEEGQATYVPTGSIDHVVAIQHKGADGVKSTYTAMIYLKGKDRPIVVDGTQAKYVVASLETATRR